MRTSLKSMRAAESKGRSCRFAAPTVRHAVFAASAVRRSVCILCMAALGIFVQPASVGAQTADTARTITIPAPKTGIIYIRAGQPGGVHIRSRRTTAARQPVLPGPLASSDVFSPADLTRLETFLSRQGLDLDIRLDRRNGRDVVVMVRRDDAAADTLSMEEAVHLLRSLGGSVGPDEALRADVPPLVERIERSILEAGMFRSLQVNFEFDRSELLPTAHPTLDAVADVLRRFPKLRIEVAGHADSIGPDAYNERLSMRRADAVQRYLIDHGIDSDRLEAAGHGEARPILSNASPTGRALNRRVEFVLLNPTEAEPYGRDERERTEMQPEAPDGGIDRLQIEDPDDQIERLRQSIRDAIRKGLNNNEINE